MTPQEIARKATWADAQALAEQLKAQAMQQGKTPPPEPLPSQDD
jgi:hypothetical protein